MEQNGFFFLLFIYFKFNASNHEKQTIGREKNKKNESRQKKNTGKHNFHLKLKQFAGLLRTVWAQKKSSQNWSEGGVEEWESERHKKKSEKRDWKMFFLTLMKPIRKQQPANQLCNKFLFLYAFHLISLIHRSCRHFLRIISGVRQKEKSSVSFHLEVKCLWILESGFKIDKTIFLLKNSFAFNLYWIP